MGVCVCMCVYSRVKHQLQVPIFIITEDTKIKRKSVINRETKN